MTTTNVDEGDTVRVEYDSAYGDRSTVAGAVTAAEHYGGPAGDCEMVEFRVGEDRRVTVFGYGGVIVEGKNGARWNRLNRDGRADSVQMEVEG